MRYLDYDHRNAKHILSGKGILEQIYEVINGLQQNQISGSLHSSIIKAFLSKHNWQKAYVVPGASRADLKRKEKYDIYDRKNKIAIEVEFTRYELLFRDFMRIMRGYNNSIVDVGIIILLCGENDARILVQSPGVAPNLELCSEYLQYFYPEIGVPILVIGLCAQLELM